MAKFCTNCGNELDDNAVMCPKCGTSFETTTTKEPKNTESKNNSMEIAGFISSFLIPMVGLILSIIGLNKAKKNNEKTGLGIAGIIISSVSIIISTIFLLAVIPAVTKTIETAQEQSEINQKAIEETQKELEEAQEEMNEIYEDYLEKYTNGDY